MLFDYGADHDSLYLAMEFVEGVEQHDILKSSREFTLQQSAGIILQALSTLDNVHELNIVHRDIKPATIALLELITSSLRNANLVDPESITEHLEEFAGRDPDNLLFDPLLQKALTIEPEERFQTAAEFSAALRELMEQSA